MSKLNSFLTALQAALGANQKAGKALAAYKPEYDRLPAEQQFAVRMRVAGIIGAAYKSTPVAKNYRGERVIGFDGGDKGGARNCLRYYFPTLNDSRGQAHKVDAVAQLLKSYAKLSKAEQRRFLAAI